MHMQYSISNYIKYGLHYTVYNALDETLENIEQGKLTTKEQAYGVFYELCWTIGQVVLNELELDKQALLYQISLHEHEYDVEYLIIKALKKCSR